MNALELAIDEIERLQPNDVEAARKRFRAFLNEDLRSPDQLTIGEALAAFALRKIQHPAIAAMCLRFLAVPGLFPEPNSVNQIERNIVEIVVSSLPDLANFLNIPAGSQTYERFAVIRGTHERISGLLTPLRKDATSVELFLSARHPIFQCLNHSAVKSYCAPFGLEEVTSCVEQIFSSIRKINSSEHSALNHQIKQFKTITDKYETQYSERHSFLIRHFFLEFLRSAMKTVENLALETRGRFASPIVTRLTHDNSIQKHYPLEEGRQRWSRLSEQIFRLDKWSLCRG